MAKEKRPIDTALTSKKEPLQLEKAYTFFMVPFYYETENAVPNINEKETIWIKDTDKISNEGEDGDVLYPYIMNFLQGQMGDNHLEQDHLNIFHLNTDKESSWYKNLWSPIANYTNVAYIPNGKNENKENIFCLIQFQILSGDADGFKAPHLFIYKAAKIGILTFCVSLSGKNKSINDLKTLNYHLHKINKPTCRCVSPKLCINDKRKFEDDNERINAENVLKETRKMIAPYDESEVYSPYEDFSWDTKGLVDLMLKDVSHNLFSNIRMHVFTYCQIDDSQEEVLSKQNLIPELLKLSRCVSDKYLLPFEQLEKDGATFESFENIYYASSVEGTAIIAVSKKSNKGFISQMDGNIRQRYLWIYMLAIIQRYTLLNMNRQLMEIDSANDEKKLWNLIDTIKNVKIRCYYTDVSPYTQHSQFYQLCCRNLHIREAFDEIEEKTNALNMTISHDLEKGQRRLNLVVGILTVFQAAGVIYEFCSTQECKFWATVITFIVGFSVLGIAIKSTKKTKK